MPKGIALLVGLTSVDAAAYGGWDGTSGCWGCELDVDNVARVLTPLGYQIATIKTKSATRAAILDGLARLAGAAEAGDIAVFYYSGHGGQQKDKDGDELDGKDETLIAYDAEVLDDDVHRAIKKFRAGVRVVMLSDSCNSGTNYRGLFDAVLPTPFLPISRTAKADIDCMLIHMGGCRDGFTSNGYVSGGAFTQALCNTWASGTFTGPLSALHARVAAAVKASGNAQDVTYTEYGEVTPAFRKQRPFVV